MSKLERYYCDCIDKLFSECKKHVKLWKCHDCCVIELSTSESYTHVHANYFILIHTTDNFLNFFQPLGNIAVGFATQAAIANANKEINGMLYPSDPKIVTAPTTYQSVYQDIFYSKYPNTSDTIIAYSPALSLVQQQYTAAKSIFGFCTSYSYMNAGLPYIGRTNGKITANCQSFGSLYLPTLKTFQDTVSYFVEGTT